MLVWQALREAGRLRNEIDSLIAERESTAKHFVRLEPECIRYVDKRAKKRELLLQSLGVAHPRVYRPAVARGGGSGRGRGGRGSHSQTRGRGSGSDDRRHRSGRGGDGGSTHRHSAVESTRARRSSVERTIHVSTAGSCTWWWRAGSEAGSDVYKPYSDEQSSLLEAAFVSYTTGDNSHGSASPGKVVLSSEYVVDFATMRQVNTRDGRKSRPVERREKQDGRKEAKDEESVALTGACVPSLEIEPEPEPEAESTWNVPIPVPLPSAPGDTEQTAASAAITMGFEATLVERVQQDQRAACGSGYEDINELLPALLAREQQERADTVPAPPAAAEPALRPVIRGVESPPVGDQPAAVWEWKADRGWKPYSSAQMVGIEGAWKSGGGESSPGSQQQQPQGRFILEGGTHAIDFGKMRQVKLGDEKRARSVRRREQSMSPAGVPSPGVAHALSPDRPMTPPVVGGGADGLSVAWEWKA
eukprot:COSAG03_NODE_739_length_6026_cov_2.211743_5_plen_475_part_00